VIPRRTIQTGRSNPWKHGLLSYVPSARRKWPALPAQRATTTLLRLDDVTGARPRLTLSRRCASTNANWPGGDRRAVGFPRLLESHGLGVSGSNRLGHATLTTSKLDQGGSYELQAEFIPAERGLAKSFVKSVPVDNPPNADLLPHYGSQFFGARGHALTFYRQRHRSAEQSVTTIPEPSIFQPYQTTRPSFPQGHTLQPPSQARIHLRRLTFHKGGAEILKSTMNNTTIHGKGDVRLSRRSNHVGGWLRQDAVPVPHVVDRLAFLFPSQEFLHGLD